MQSLIDRLSKLDAPDREVDGEIMQAIDPVLWSKAYLLAQEPCGCSKEMATEDAKLRAPLYTASLDAAIALAERVLPGKARKIVWEEGRAVVVISQATHLHEVAPTVVQTHDHAAIALCIALLRAKEATNGQ